MTPTLSDRSRRFRRGTRREIPHDADWTSATTDHPVRLLRPAGSRECVCDAFRVRLRSESVPKPAVERSCEQLTDEQSLTPSDGLWSAVEPSETNHVNDH